MRPLSGSDESLEVSVGDVTSHQLQNLQPGTTYDLKVLALYKSGMSGPLLGQGTTRMYREQPRGFWLPNSKNIEYIYNDTEWIQ